VADEQDALLSALDKSETPAAVWNPAQAKQFFEMILSHTMQAFYGDPRHGGNREMASWRMLGVPITPVRGREQYDLTRRDS
jgi:gluconate 2-dehydrogenase gamma chain